MMYASLVGEKHYELERMDDIASPVCIFTLYNATSDLLSTVFVMGIEQTAFSAEEPLKVVDLLLRGRPLSGFLAEDRRSCSGGG